VSRLSHRGPMNEDELFASHLLLKERNLSEILSERK